ncbi:MAG TPA: S-adenosylmethionine:tRNA ribosyltransferase-isomerase [Egicoccus sp.]|nr:S-adenosylmethionine:tRNA ribosyltransferase-isomerase [Egicoccus sp.]HSK24202.1 S-adenosylmethionine:tRNA ribosyltransferase-isomerase [Egicoccus sp.]
MNAATADAGFAFELPPGRDATAPPEARGLARDEVRLLVARPDRIEHTRFRTLPAHLRPGDLVVVNTSATLPAALDGLRRGSRPVVVHVAGPHPDDDAAWVVELRRPDGNGPERDGRSGEVVRLPGEVGLRLVAPHPDPLVRVGSRLWRAHPDPPQPHELYLLEHGRPITYGYLAGRWPLEVYQPVHARAPGSAEMASAGRPFTARLLVDLVARGIQVAPVVLHAGVSSPEADEPPQPERFVVPTTTARLATHTRADGGRIVAVGTTAVRALESAAREDGAIRASRGWTDLVLSAQRPARVVDGLVTGWHAPGASHLALLEAVAGPELVEQAYTAALDDGDYLWHEFGDSCLLLP